jgi:hypothetical protein
MTLSQKQFVQDDGVLLDYMIDWSQWLGTDTIATSTWTVPTGLTLNAQSNTTTTATAWFKDGVVGQNYPCVNRITTAGGRISEWTIIITVEDL